MAPDTTPHGTQDEDALSILREEFRAALLAFGIGCPPELEQSFIDRTVHRVGGGQMYVPRTSAQRRREVRERVLTAYNGRNAPELSRETGLSVRRIQQIGSARRASAHAK